MAHINNFIKDLITFPCNNKIPCVKKWNEIKKTIPHQIKQNYGILTGKINNIVVIDCDVIKNDDPDKFMCGVNAWNLINERFPELKYERIPIVKTNNGGLHIYFKYTDQIKTGIQPFKANLIDQNDQRTIKIDILSDNRFVIGPGSNGYEFIKDTQYYDPPDFPDYLIKFLLKEVIKKYYEYDYNEVKFPLIKAPKHELKQSFISKETLKHNVNNIPSIFADNYETWIKIVWGIAQTALTNGYKALDIADDFSKQSTKYKDIEDVKKVYKQNKGDITYGTLMHYSNIEQSSEKSENLNEVNETNKHNLIKDINNILPEYIKNVVSIEDEKLYKVCDFITEDDHKVSIKIYKDNLITTNDNDVFLGYLRSILNIKYDLSVIHSEFKDDCDVIFIDQNTIDFVSKTSKSGEHRIRIKHPWDVKKRYFTKYSFGKQIGNMRKSKQELTVMVDEAIRNACHLTLRDRYNLNINVQGDLNIYNADKKEDLIRSEEQMIKDLISSHPGILDCFKFSDSTGLFKGLFLYGPNTGIWRRENNGVLEKMLSTRIKKFVPALTQEEVKYIETNKNIQQLRMMFVKEIDDKDFESNIDENRDVFAMTNCVFDIKTKEFRKSTPLDFVYTNSLWAYNKEDANKYLNDVQDFFQKLFPIKEEHDVVVTFFASLIHGYRLDKKFLALTDKRNGNNGKSTLIVLLRKFFGDYTKTSNKFLLKGSFDKDKDSHDGGLEPLKGKRILVCDELKKNMRLDEGLIKNLAGGEYVIEGRRLGRSDQFKFTWQAGIIMIFNEGDCPKFDSTDNAFMERMVIVPMRSKFIVGKEDENTFTFKRDPNIVQKFDKWRSSVVKFLLNYVNINGLTHCEIPKSMIEWKEEILNDNNELRDWLFSIIEEDKDSFVSLSELRDKYKEAFPYEKSLKNKDIERMINALFNNKGVYITEVYQYREDGKMKKNRNIYKGFKIK